MAQEWHVHKDGQTLGPYTWEELQTQAESGEINRTDMIWKEGMSEWNPADQVQDLFPAGPAPPPPPPPASDTQAPPPPPPASAALAAHTSDQSTAPTHARRQPREQVMSVRSWLGTLILLYIPLLNLLLLFVWAFSSSTNRNKQNFSRATLLLGVLVGIVIFFVYVVFLAGSAIFAFL